MARAAGALSFMGVPNKELAEAWRRALEGARDDTTAFLAARGLIGIGQPEKLAPAILDYLAKNAEEAAHPKPGRSTFDDSKSAENAAKALHHLLQEGAAPLLPLLDRTVGQSPNSGRYVLGQLASIKTLPPGTVDLALAHTRSSVAETRDAAINLAGKVTNEREAARWIPEAIRLLGDPDDSVRMKACWALKGVRGLARAAAPELTRLLTEDPLVKVKQIAAATGRSRPGGSSRRSVCLPDRPRSIWRRTPGPPSSGSSAAASAARGRSRPAARQPSSRLPRPRRRQGPPLLRRMKAGAKLNLRNGSNLTALEMGIVSGNPGLEELIDAGARLDAAKARTWAEAYKKNPRALALIKKASGN